MQEAHGEVRGDGGAERARRAPARGRRRPGSPKRSGSFSTAAAPMIGVASRNAKRAASSFESPASRPPPIVAPEREKPGMSASACAAPIAERLAPADALGDARSGSPGVVALRRAAAQPLGAVEQHAVEHQEDRRRRGRRRTPCAAGARAQPEDPGRDRADDEQPAELRVGVVGRDLAVAQRAAEAAHDPHPVAPEEAEQDERGREVGRDQEGEEVVVVLVDVPAEQPRQDHGVARGSRSGTARRRPGARPRTIAWR